jgi:riboflavin kinase/FMN adenylyltransferase
MKTVHYQKIPKSVTSSVVSVGNFDGIHRGHELLIREVVKRARETGGASIIVTFDPHTRSVLTPGGMQPILSTLEEKAFLLELSGVDYLAWIPFDAAIANLAPIEFVETILKKEFRASAWVLGEEHTFGKDHAGNRNFLQSGVGKNHITTFAISSLSLQNTVVSSTEIRKALVEGRVAEAAQMLGHPYLVSAKRVGGIKKGTELGFPTLNFARPGVNKVLPPTGVYAASLDYKGRKRPGAFYFGNCPTFAGREFHCEFHELHYTGDADAPGEGETGFLWLYDCVRRDQTFTSQENLVRQMEKDIETIKKMNFNQLSLQE